MNWAHIAVIHLCDGKNITTRRGELDELSQHITLPAATYGREIAAEQKSYSMFPHNMFSLGVYAEVPK